MQTCPREKPAPAKAGVGIGAGFALAKQRLGQWPEASSNLKSLPCEMSLRLSHQGRNYPIGAAAISSGFNLQFSRADSSARNFENKICVICVIRG